MEECPVEHIPVEEDGPWSTMTCRNHPKLRWARKNPIHMQGMISNNPQLMFDGDVDGGKSMDFMTNFETIPDHVKTFEDALKWIERVKEKHALGYVSECTCPISDLYYVDEKRD